MLEGWEQNAMMMRPQSGLVVAGVVALLGALALSSCCCPSSCPPPCIYDAPPGAPDAPTAAVADGTLRVTSSPPADVWIDGNSAGVSPIEIDLPPGPHAVRIRLGGFEVHESTAHVSSGKPTKLDVKLILVDPEEREGLQLVADVALPEEESMWVQTFEAPRPHRGGGPPQAVRVVFPRGPVRARDLRRFQVEFASDTPRKGAVEFRRGAQLLDRFVVEDGQSEELAESIPQRVRDAVKPGDTVTWGFYPTNGAPTTASFKVVDKNLKAAIGTISKSFKGQPGVAIAHMRAQLYLNHGLYYAAHEEAQAILQADGNSARAWAVVLESLNKMGVAKSTLAWKAAQSAVGGASPKQKQQLHFMPGGDLRRVSTHLERGDAGRAGTTLRTHLKSGARPDATQLRGLAQAAAGNAGAMAKKAPGAGKAFVSQLRTLVREAQEKGADDASMRWATAQLHLAEGRIRRQSGANPGPKLWLKAVETIEPTLAKDPDAAPGYVQAVHWLHEAASLRGVDPKPLLNRARLLADQLTLRFPERPESALMAVSTQMLQVETQPKMPRKKLRQAVTECVDTLLPHLADPNPPRAIGTLYTRAVTTAKTRKLRLGFEYHPTEGEDDRGLITYKVPLSERWEVTREALGPYSVLLRQLDETGTLQRLVAVVIYEWGLVYRFHDARSTGGENIGALSKLGMEDALRTFRKVKRKRKSMVRKLSRRYTRAYNYDIKGETRDGSYLRLRSWVTKSKEHKVSYLVQVHEYTDNLPTIDHELMYVLESFADRED